MSQNIRSPSYTRIYAYVRIANTAVRCAGSVASRVRPHTASQPAMTMQQCEQRRVSECAAVFIVQTHTEAEHHKPALSCAVLCCAIACQQREPCSPSLLSDQTGHSLPFEWRVRADATSLFVCLRASACVSTICEEHQAQVLATEWAFRCDK